jgi:hypothetical protein
MFTSSECCAIAEKKLAQAESDDRNRRRLVNAAKSWLFLASRLSGKETAFSIDTVIAKRRSMKRQKGNGASTNSSRYVRQHVEKTERS